jgi:hypothetical protein
MTRSDNQRQEGDSVALTDQPQTGLLIHDWPPVNQANEPNLEFLPDRSL